ncbi:hypothetical protein DASC09_057440 [Saccharomycopsis crataegensis]|uniref:Ubiquitin-like domain-containing protein n=1 Tax=Saccharomycopsis crataegensis TaxID=43959 RepID=A0AAV5QW37_9ASCO|nr:hypothetical protein DASC09_057440 [Saccharomycopsis crataegensis]
MLLIVKASGSDKSTSVMVDNGCTILQAKELIGNHIGLPPKNLSLWLRIPDGDEFQSAKLADVTIAEGCTLQASFKFDLSINSTISENDIDVINDEDTQAQASSTESIEEISAPSLPDLVEVPSFSISNRNDISPNIISTLSVPQVQPSVTTVSSLISPSVPAPKEISAPSLIQSTNRTSPSPNPDTVASSNLDVSSVSSQSFVDVTTNNNFPPSYVRGSIEIDGPPPSFDEIHLSSPYGEATSSSPPTYEQSTSTNVSRTTSRRSSSAITEIPPVHNLIVWYNNIPIVVSLDQESSIASIQRQLINKVGCPLENQILKDSEGNILNHNDKLSSIDSAHFFLTNSASEGSNDGDIPLKIRVIRGGNKIHTVTVSSLQETVGFLKRKLIPISLNNIEAQKLVFKGSILSNERALSSYKIKKNDEILLFTLNFGTIGYSAYNIKVDLYYFPNNRKVTTGLKASEDKLSDLIKKAKDNGALSAFAVKIWFKGKEVVATEDQTLKALGIGDGSSLLVQAV